MIQPATLFPQEAAGGQMKTPPTLTAGFPAYITKQTMKFGS
jgi:hypothetical protein